tara:strand:- start:184 stop:678 length:495 start_codon:yes stop_codon:yes gene_type:complete
MAKKNSLFKRKERDFYPTIDPQSVISIANFIKGKKYYEPCCGDGSLIRILDDYAECVGASDVEKDATSLEKKDIFNATIFITNPPYTWNILQPILNHLPNILPTLLMLPSDMMHNQRMSLHMKRCKSVWSVGRLYWQPNKVKGLDNYCWYLFQAKETLTTFYGR